MVYDSFGDEFKKVAMMSGGKQITIVEETLQTLLAFKLKLKHLKRLVRDTGGGVEKVCLEGLSEGFFGRGGAERQRK